MNRRTQNMAVVAIGLSVMLACSGCQPVKEQEHPPLQNQAHAQTSPALQAVSLASSKNLWCTLPIIAKHQGFFAAEGLDVSIEYVQAAKLAMDALVSSSSDFSTVVEANVAYLAYTGNENVNVIATIVESYDGAIVARKDSGIEQPADLKGKSLGILQGTTSQFYAEKFLEKHGLSAKDVDVQNLQPVAIQTAIVEKGIDAGSLWQPFTFNIIKALEGQATVFNDSSVYTGFMNIAVRKDWAEKNTVTVESFIRALVKSRQFVADNRDQAQQIMAKEVNLDVEVVKAIWNQYSFTLKLDVQQLLKPINDEALWIKNTQDGFADKAIPDYSKYLNANYLSNAAKP